MPPRFGGMPDILARTPQHASALATRDRLHRQAGLEPPHVTVEHDLQHDRGHDLQHDIARAQARLDALQRPSPGRSLEL